jgi:hypothetical protein
MQSYTVPSGARSGAVVSSYTPAYTGAATSAYSMGGTSRVVGGTQGISTSRVVGGTQALNGSSSFSTSYSARPTTIGTSAPVSYTTAAQTYASAATPTTFTTGSSRVIQSAPQYAQQQQQQQYVGSIPTVTAAPVNYVSQFAAPQMQMVETIAPGMVETISAPRVVETFVSPSGIVETVVAEAPVEVIAQEEPFTLTYWPLFGKGAAPVIALQVGGFQWQLGAAPGSKGSGDLWAEWLEMKPYTPWGFLPNLDIGQGELIGSEFAILQFLAKRGGAPLQGATDAEFRISQELLHQSEELYQKLSQKCPTIMAPDKSVADFEALWLGVDRESHSSQQGIPVYLTQFEEFYAKVGGRDGLFTSSGVTIGEIKLYATLAVLLLIDNGILQNYPGLLEFYMRWENDPRVRVGETTILDVALQEWGWQQYFIAPPPEAPAQ